MVKDVEYFKKLFVKQIKFIKRHARSNRGYGEDVMPILDAYHNLTEFDERKSFRDAIVSFLEDPDDEKRDFAIELCLGFFQFRDAIGR